MKEAHRHRITGFNGSHVTHTQLETRPSHYRRPLRAKYDEAKSLIHKYGITEVWFPSNYVPGSKPIFKRPVDKADILKKVGVLMDTDLSKGDWQLVGSFLNRGVSRYLAPRSVSHEVLSQIRDVYNLIEAGEYNPDNRPPPYKNKKRSEAHINMNNHMVRKVAKGRIEKAL